jgi:TolB-like protein
MMRRLLVLMLAGLLCVLQGCASSRTARAEQYDWSGLKTIAVAEVRGDVRSEAAKDQVGHYFAIELLGRGYSLVERRSVKAILAEQDFQFSDLTSRRNMATAGEILNAGAILTAAVTVSGERMAVSAEVIEVESGRVIWAAAREGNRKETVFTVVGAVAGGLVGWAAGGDEEGEIAGGVSGGAVGGTIGQALSPSEQKLARKLIGGMCNRFPQSKGPR